MLEATVFLLVSAGALALSWGSLRRRDHGYYRFFAFELILGLIVLNASVWFRDPYSPSQLLSWALLLASILLAAHGFFLLRVVGKPRTGIETTTRLVEVGAYRFIRHPLYASLLGLAWGAALKDLTVLTGLIALGASLCLFLTARAEEAENLVRFGSDYAAYMQRTRRFIPFVF